MEIKELPAARDRSRPKERWGLRRVLGDRNTEFEGKATQEKHLRKTLSFALLADRTTPKQMK